MKKDLKERNHLCEDQPNIDQFDVSCGRQTLRNRNEECRQHQQGGQVDGHNSLKEEVFEEVGCVDDDKDEDCRKVDGEDCIIDPSLQCQLYVNTRPTVS